MIEIKLSYEMWCVGHWAVGVPHVSYKYCYLPCKGSSLPSCLSRTELCCRPSGRTRTWSLVFTWRRQTAQRRCSGTSGRPTRMWFIFTTDGRYESLMSLSTQVRTFYIKPEIFVNISTILGERVCCILLEIQTKQIPALLWLRCHWLYFVCC